VPAVRWRACSATDWTVGALIASRTCLVSSSSCRRREEQTRSTARDSRYGAGYLLAVACLLYRLADGGSTSALVFALLRFATLVGAAGEVVQSRSAWGLASALAPVTKAPLYQSLFSTGYSSTVVVAPLAGTAGYGRRLARLAAWRLHLRHLRPGATARLTTRRGANVTATAPAPRPRLEEVEPRLGRQLQQPRRSLADAGARA
jgi:hypothetical protein